jgi:hypothetical protein
MINLRCTEIGDEGARSIAEMLRVNSSLQMINLHHNYIGADGIGAIVEALEFNSSLQEIGFPQFQWENLQLMEQALH